MSKTFVIVELDEHGNQSAHWTNDLTTEEAAEILEDMSMLLKCQIKVSA